MADFLHVYVVPKQGATRAQVEQKLNLARDWFRYYGNVYIVYTTSDIGKWYERLMSLVKPDGSLFICRFDMDAYQGWMAEDFWDWIKEKRRER